MRRQRKKSGKRAENSRSKVQKGAPLFWTVKFVALCSAERASTFPHSHCSVAIQSLSCISQHPDGLTPALQWSATASAPRSKRKPKGFIEKKLKKAKNISGIIQQEDSYFCIEINTGCSNTTSHLLPVHPLSSCSSASPKWRGSGWEAAQGPEGGTYQIIGLQPSW